MEHQRTYHVSVKSMPCKHDVEIFFDGVIGKGLALVLVKAFQMSVGHDDEIVMGQIPLEQQRYKGEGT